MAIVYSLETRQKDFLFNFSFFIMITLVLLCNLMCVCMDVGVVVSVCAYLKLV